MPSIAVTQEMAVALRNSTSPADRLASWTLRWSLFSGLLQCMHCQASQLANRCGEGFMHRPGCCASREKQPWQELAALLDAAA